MMKSVKILFILIWSLFAFQTVRLVKTKIGKSITVSLPEDFELMSQSEIRSRFVSAREPLAIYSDETRNVDFTVNIAYSKWNPEDLELMQSFYKSNIMGLYDAVRFIQEDIREINGRRFAVFEFVSSVKGQSDSPGFSNGIGRYTYIQYTIINGKTVLFNLSCPAHLKDIWGPVAKEIMGSVRIKDTI